MMNRFRIALAAIIMAAAAVSAVNSASAGIDVSWAIWEWRKFGP
jgi:hypothetical protein